MREVHGRPPDPQRICDEQRTQLGEDMAHEQGLYRGATGVERGKGTKDDGRGGEAGRVQIDAEQLIDAGETGGRTGHGVIGRSEAIEILVPWTN